MSGKTLLALLFLFTLALAMVGCSGDATVTSEQNQSSTVNGEVDPNAASIEYTIAESSDPNRPGGPYVLRGSNIHYNDLIGALFVDFTITNVGRVAHPEPIALTFVRLLPKDVTVINPDNDEHGAGATIVFQFENDDAQWTPGETSFPRTVQFRVVRGRAVGFAARLDIAMPLDGGSIGGVVWLDLNRDGERDANEPGLAGMEMFLRTQDSEKLMGPEILRRTITGRDGTYRFDHLGPGHYVVFKNTGADLPLGVTTDREIHVLLTRTEGGVTSFLLADFGCVWDDAFAIEPGDYVRVSGKFADAATANVAGVITATEVMLRKCGDRGCVVPTGLAGPVTAVNRDERSLRIMTEWVTFEADSSPQVTAAGLDPDDVEVGDRVICGIDESGNSNGVIAPLKGFGLREWFEDYEMANAIVRRVGGTGQNNSPITLVLLRSTVVLVTADTKIIVLED